jgi:ADP-ribose pyrophosphatase YjhB (NUDIX family)
MGRAELLTWYPHRADVPPTLWRQLLEKARAQIDILVYAALFLLQRRTDNELWGLPGGAMSLGETVGQAVAREVREETGLEVEPTGLVGIYSDPGHIIAYADGEVRQEFSLCFTARIVGGDARVGDEESTEVRFVAPGEVQRLPIHRSTRLRIEHFLERRGAPFFT